MRTFEELQHTAWLIGELKEKGDFEGATQLLEELIVDALLHIISSLSINETEMKQQLILAGGMTS
mgnify:FL=1